MDLLLLDAIFGSVGEAIIKVLLNALALMAGAHLLKGVDIEDFSRALIVAVVLSFLNATLGSFLQWITTPLRFLTLGLFTFVVNAILLLLAAHFLKGFKIRDFLSAFILAILMAVFTTVLYGIFL